MIGVVYIVGAIILGLIIAYGLWQYYNRDKTKDPMTEAATRQLYESYEKDGGREPRA